MISREKTVRTFNEYVAAYNADDPKISLKIAHTYRTAALCERIGRDAGVPDVDLAWLCGMLHDIGRFEQIRRYNTFSDAASVDHAVFGADLLFREGLLQTFSPDLSPEQRRLLESSIRGHSAYRLSPDLTAAERAYCSVLRDADKVDIFRVNCETPLEEIYNVTTEELANSAVSEEVKACFRDRTTVLRRMKKTAADNVVAILCLVFELVYPISRQIARQQGYVDRLLAFRSRDPDTAAWFDYMRGHIW